MKTLKALLQKYKDIVLYVVFGGLTTLVNIVSFYVLEQLLAVATVPATCVAWALSVLFAYVTNRRWVFESKENTRRGILREMGSFFLFRLLSGLMDVAIMYMCVDLLGWNSMIIKVLSNVLVIIVNYVASKLVIFRKR